MLPRLPNSSGAKRYQTVSPRGINRTQATTEGDLSDAYGITAEDHPILRQRDARRKITKPDGTPYSDPSQIWEWNGKLLVIDETNLYYGGEFICHVSDGQKQFAVVNTKLVVWPDKLMIDLGTNEYRQMDASVVTGSGVTATENTVTAPSIVKIARECKTVTCGGGVDTWTPYVMTFGKDAPAVEACFANGAWNVEALSKIAVVSVYWNYGTSFHELSAGDIIIPGFSNGTFGGPGVSGSASRLYYPENDLGYYGILTGAGGYYDKDTEKWDNLYALSSCGGSRVAFFYDVYRCGVGTSARLSDTFSPGDWIELRGMGHDGERKKITEVGDHTITFTPKFDTAPGGTFSEVTILRSIPDLDYICEKDNRLWGASDRDRTVYASALGDPMDWWTYDGVSTDAYALAIGSEGNFTGVVSYGGGVCFFKQDRLHKLLGDIPENFYSAEYRIAGIQEGSNRSTVIVNEVLYYKGVDGVYAYTGGTPTMISAALGNDAYTDAVSGAHGNCLYFCMADGNSVFNVFTYNIRNGLWMKEGCEHILAYTTIDADMYCLRESVTEDNAVFMYTREGAEPVDWMAEFVPCYGAGRASGSAMLGRKTYTRIIARIDFTGELKIEVRNDDGPWREVLHRHTDRTSVITAPLPLVRCDRYQYRFSGKGTVNIRTIQREFTTGSTR